jgi:nicotinate-nucleotide--dimethylbenzimidazole phosphoribosyltransferase
MDLLKSTVEKIKPVNADWYSLAQKHLDNLTKPLGSLGRLEEFARRLVAITENKNPHLDRKVIFTFAGDHGVVAEGVSAYPQEVTAQMVFNFLRGGAGINVLARHAGAEVVVADIGVAHDFGELKGLAGKKVMSGTKNFLKGPAMTRDEAIQCIEVGIGLPMNTRKRISHSAPATRGLEIQLLWRYRRCMTGPVSEVTGKGTGISDDRSEKISVIEGHQAEQAGCR